jgi:hypothetical protein
MPATLSATAISFIRELLNDGNSDIQICRIVRRKWPFIPNKSIRDCINRIMDEEDETASEASSTDSEPAMDIEEYDSDDSSDEDYVPEEDSDSESEDEDDEEDPTSEDEEVKEDNEEVKEAIPSHLFFNEKGDVLPTQKPAKGLSELHQAHLYIEHTDDRVDHINIKPNGQGTFELRIMYDSAAKHHNFFEADIPHVIEYLNQVLSMLMIDQMPFKMVEVMVPFFPSIVVTPDSFRMENHRIIILRAFHQYMEHYAQVA